MFSYFFQDPYSPFLNSQFFKFPCVLGIGSKDFQHSCCKSIYHNNHKHHVIPEPPATTLLIPIWSASLMLDCCSDIDDVLDTLLATPLVVTPLDIILVLVVMAKVLLEGSEELTDMACMLVVEDW